MITDYPDYLRDEYMQILKEIISSGQGNNDLMVK
jgi:hypothetical protein